MGDSCAAWDASMDYCQEGGSSFGASWCPQAWCYTEEACPGAAAGSYFAAQDGPPGSLDRGSLRG